MSLGIVEIGALEVREWRVARGCQPGSSGRHEITELDHEVRNEQGFAETRERWPWPCWNVS